MIAGAARALGRGLVIVLCAVTVAFAILHLAPGDPVHTLVGPHATPETMAEARAHHGLDRSLPAQYATMLGHLARGDLGESFRTHRPVREIIVERLGPTLQLMAAVLVLQIVFGVPLGVVAARRRGRAADRAVGVGTVLALSAPPFVLATVLLYLVGFLWGWLPILGYGEGLVERLRHLALPALSLAAGGAAMTAQLVRAELVRTLAEDYVRTARAKGLPERAVVWRHALRPALIAAVAALGTELAMVLTGAVAVESIFGWPGLGREALQAVLELDIPLILGVVIVGAVAVTIINVVSELVQRRLDPRHEEAE